MIKFVLLFLLALSSCRSTESSNVRSFRSYRPTTNEVVDTKLAFFPNDIPYRIEKIKFELDGPRYHESYSYRVVLPELNQVDILAIKEMYSSWSATQTKVKFFQDSEGPHYLVDFLPPLFQYLEGKNYVMDWLNSPGLGSVRQKVFTNCWTTVYAIYKQALDQSSSFSAFYAGTSLPEHLLENNNVHVVEEIPATSDVDSQTESAGSEKELKILRELSKPGDLLLFVGLDQFNQEYSKPVHLAILIDPNLVFEKPGYRPEHMSRFELTSNVLNRYRSYKKVLLRNSSSSWPDEQLIIDEENRRQGSQVYRSINFELKFDEKGYVKKAVPVDVIPDQLR